MLFLDGFPNKKLLNEEVTEFLKAKYVVFSSSKTSIECCKMPLSTKQKC